MVSNIQVHSVKNECLVPLMQTLLSLMLTMKLQDTNEKNIFTDVLNKLLVIAEIEDSDSKVSTFKYCLINVVGNIS